VVRLENFENLERRINKLVRQFSQLKKERDGISDVLKKGNRESLEAKGRLENLYKERHQMRSKLDALIEKLENLEHMDKN